MVEVNVTIPPETVRYLRKLSEMPRQTTAAIQTGLDNALEIIKERIQENRLSGEGPFAPSRHKLGERSGELKSSVYTRSTVRGQTVIGYVGSDVPYAGVHEYGAVINARNAPFLVFKVLGKIYRKKSVVIPARAPFGTEMGLVRTTNVIAQNIAREVAALGSE